MRRTIKNVFFMMLVACLFMTNLVNAADPTVTVDPEAPIAESTVSFTAELDDEDVIGVWLKVQECNANSGICFPDSLQNISMTEQDSEYKASVTLSHDDATYIQYTIYVETSEGLLEYLKDTKINLSEQQNSNGTGNGGDDDNGTPGFEVISLLLAVLVGVSLLKRKRFR